MSNPHNADRAIQIIRDMVDNGQTDILLEWLEKEMFVAMMSPKLTPSERERCWHSLAEKGYEPDPDRPFSLRKRSAVEKPPLPTKAEVRRRFDILMDPDISPEEKSPIIETLIEWGWGDVTFRKG